MQRRIFAALGVAALALGPAWTGCATQQDTGAKSSLETTGATSGAETGGKPGGGSAAGGKAGGSQVTGGTFGNGGKPGGGSGGAIPASGGEPSAGGAPSEGGAGGAESGCGIAADCNDDDPCTTDVCQLKTCTHTANTAPCEDDNDPCTNDVCGQGSCKHPDNQACECKQDVDCNDQNLCTDDTCTTNKCGHTNNTVACTDDGRTCTDDKCAAGQCGHVKNNSCECLTAADCDDSDPGTFNQCNGSGVCVYPDSDTCGLGAAFTVDSFNSNADWIANKTSPDQRALLQTGFTNPNLEGNANIYLAANGAASLELGLAPMSGLCKLRIVIKAVRAGTESMVSVGVWDGLAWTEKLLSGYAAVPTAQYATIEVPLVDFGVMPNLMTKMRLRFAPTGLREWRIDEINVSAN